MTTSATKFLCPSCSSSLNQIGKKRVCSTCGYSIDVPELLSIPDKSYQFEIIWNELKELNQSLKDIKDLLKAQQPTKVLKD